MNLKSVTLLNFKPFYGEEPIPFCDTSGLTLFGAKNDRGKTAFLEAIRFCLYDFKSDDSGTKEEKRDQCINRKAVTEASGETAVSISFEHNGSDYTIKRALEFSRVDNTSAREVDKHYVTVEIDSDDDLYIDTREDDEITDYREFREGILPEDASRFFIFDGEQIDEYAQHFGKRDADVREAIELVLGIEELRKAEADLEEYGIENYREEFQEAQSEAEEYDEKKQEVQDARNTLEDLEEDLEEKVEERDEKETEKSQVEERLADASDVQEKYEQLIETRAQLFGPDEVDKAEEYLTEEKIEDLQPGVQTTLQDKREDRQKIYQLFGPIAGAVAADEIDSLDILDSPTGLEAVLQQTLEEMPDDCYVCLQDLEDVPRSELIQRLDDTRNESTKEAQYLDQLADGLRDATEGDDYDPGSQKTQFDILTDQITDLKQTRTKLQQRIESLVQTIDNAKFGTDEVDEIRTQKEDLTRQIERLRIEVSDLEEDISEQEDTVDKLVDELESMEGASEDEDRFSKLVDVTEQAKESFTKAKDRYVERRRTSVEDKASRLFRQMTNKSDVYRGLSIHTDYQLRIETTDGTFTIADQDPSRGARQIIAYAFIAGLAKFTSRDAPILIDTPIARLDPGHKERLIDNLPQFADQVIVFYQPNELTEDDVEDLEDDDAIAAHYDIIQGDDAQVSHIVDHDPSHFERGDEE